MVAAVHNGQVSRNGLHVGDVQNRLTNGHVPDRLNGQGGHHLNGDGGLLRNARGQFAVGNKGGPGRPPRRREFREQVLAECSVKDGRRIIRAMIEAAAGGDARAASVVLPWLLGRVPDIDSEEHERAEGWTRKILAVLDDMREGREHPSLEQLQQWPGRHMSALHELVLDFLRDDDAKLAAKGRDHRSNEGA